MTTKRIFFLHSAGAQHDEEGSAKLIGYIKAKLSDSYQVIAPIMPDPDNPEYERWRKALIEIFRIVDENTILIGHSLGGSVLLKFLSEEHPIQRLKALYLIAVPYWGSEGWDVSEFLLSADFAGKLPEIDNIVIYQSEDDDIVSPRHAEIYAAQLPGSEYHLLKGHGHVFWDGLPELIEHIRNSNSG